MNRYINIVGGLTLWGVCILILVDPTGWIAKQHLTTIMAIYATAGFIWYAGSILIGRAVNQDDE